MTETLFSGIVSRRLGVVLLGVALAVMSAMTSFSFAADLTGGTEHTGYGRIFVAPVRIAEALETRPETGVGRTRHDEERAVRKADLTDKSEDLHKAILAALTDDFELVETAGTGVLTIEPVLVELRSSRPTFADFNRQPGLSARSEYAGGAKVTFELSENGAALEPFDASWFGNIERHRRKVGIWTDADRAFRIISRRLREHLRP